MSDITTVWNVKHSRGDWIVQAGDLRGGDDLSTALFISLFSDRLARSDDPVEDNNFRGWWGDQGADYPIGSRLWLLARRKLVKSVAEEAVTYIKEALQWMIDDQVVSHLEITYQLKHPSSLYVRNRLFRPDGTVKEVNFDWAWEDVSNAIQ